MLRKITYTDKEDILGLTAVDNKNKVTAQDMNDIKNAINDNTDELDKIKVNKSGSDMTGALNFAQNVWNKFGSNVAVGAINTAGTLGIIGLDGTTGVHLIPKNGNNNEGVTWSCDADGNSTMSGTLNGSFKGPLNGNAATTTKLQTARTINGTSFDGTTNIITNAWGTARDITLGLTKKSVNGSTNMSWTLAEMGALPAAGGTMTGSLIVEKPVTFKDTLTVNGVTDLNNVLNVTGATALKSTLDVTGATTLKSTLGVTGATTLGSTLSVTGIATLKNDTNINGALSVDKATTLKNTLNVTGITTLKNNAIINGTLSVDGATSLKNTLGVTGATTLGSTLDVTGVSTFTGNSIFKNNATVNGVLTVGGVTNLNNVLNVTGATALKSTLDVTGATTLGSTLSVTGDTVLKSNATVKGDLTVEGATTFNDELNITGDTTIDGALNITGATILGSTLDVTGIATFKNNTNINGTLSVDKATTLKSTLNVTGATTLGSTLNVTGITTLKNNAIINGTLSVDGATSLKNTLGVTGATTLGSTLSVTGIATLKNDTNINGALSVDKATTLKNTLGVTGATTLSNTLTVSGITNLNNALNVTGATALKSTLGVTGATTLNGTLDVTKATTLKDTLGVTGATTLGSTLGVTGATSLKSTLGVTGATTLSNTLTVSGITNLNNTLNVTGATALKSTLGVTGVATFNDNSSFKKNINIDGVLNSSLTTGTHLQGNQGKAIINSTATAGSYTMLAKMNSTNGYFTTGTHNGGYLLQYTAKSTVDAGTNAVTKSVTLLDESGNATFPERVTAKEFYGTFIGNSSTVTKLQTARKINDTSFDGTADITTTKWGTARNISIADSDATNTGAAVSVNGSGNATLKLPATIKASLTGNASTATTLQTARTINGTSFNGSANITTANWGTARDISIADSDATNTGVAVSVNGSGNATLKLPATIKATLTGNASTATKATKDGDGNVITSTYRKISDSYTKNEVDNKFSTLETAIDWKESVATFSDIAKKYPTPDDGWTVNVKDTDYTYRYSGKQWVVISANAIPKVTGSVDGLMTTDLYNKLVGIQNNATKITVDTKMSTSSTNPVQNKVVQSALDTKLNTSGGTITGALTVNGGITGSLTGNASTATKLATARTISLTGSVTGSGTFDGSGNLSIATTTNHTHSYLPLSGGTMGSAAYISWPDSGNWTNNNSGVTFPVDRGGFNWSGQSDGIKLYAEETSNDNLELVLKFADDDSNGLSIRNSLGKQTARISASGVFTGSFSGNASTATKLATARTINGTSFDGSANITTANWGTARNIYIADSDATNTGAAVSVNGSGNTTLKLPATIKATLTGNASTATKLATARTIALTGSVTGSGTFDGSGNLSIATTTNHSHNHTTSVGRHNETASGTAANSPNAGMAISSGLYMTETYSDSASPVSYGNIINIAGSGTGQLLCEWSGTDSTTGHLYYRSHRDTSTGGWGSWRQVMFSGDNAATATKLATARNIAISGAVTGNANFDGSGNINISTSVNHSHNYAGSSSAGGVANSAAKLATARTISLTGSVTGSGTFDGSGNLSIATTTNHTHSYLPLSGGSMTGNINFNGRGNNYIGAGPRDGAGGVGEELNNLVISAWYGVSFTTLCDGEYQNKNAVSINTRTGHVYANTYHGALSGNASTATKLATARTINGTSFDGSADITTANWGTARNIYIADSDATNTGAAVSVNGSGNATLKLPATIKASLTGNASTASALQDYNSASNTIQIGYSGSSLTSSEVAYLAAYKSGGKQIKDVPVSTVKTLMGIKNSTLNVTCSSSNWSGSAAPYTNTINVTGVTASNIVEVGLNNASATDAQVQACMKASIAKITQENGKIKLYAYGTKPTVNIPMTVAILTT